ncbi:MAG TPA: redoxin domain-containing protein [Bryobacteraceae bacterium]|jgi:thioredoxin-related protein|nr:redoxin domain-containing protein [Bryobacteraceae bacterium]
MRILFASLLFGASIFASDFSIGSRVADIVVKDGEAPVVVSPAKSPATVVIFVSTRCPISNAYNQRMSAIYRDYQNKGVQFVYVNSNSNESQAEIQEHTNGNQLSYKVYKDAGNVLADQFGAQMTPEAYVFDRQGVLQYHGYVDDAKNESRVQVQGLRKAIDAVLAGRSPELRDTKAFGCTIKRVRRAS